MRDRNWRGSRAGDVLAAALVLALGLPACMRPPDPDGVPAGALQLPLRQAFQDRLDCRRNDCADWFRVRVTEKGTLSVTVTASDADQEPPHFNLTLTDADGRTLGREQSAGRRGVSLAREVDVATYLAAIATPHPRGTLGYEITLGFEPAPPPPPPEPEAQFRIETSAVLEVEGWGEDSQAILIEPGASHGIRPGLRGRVIADGETIGEIVIEQVYPDGSRARIEGTLVSPITPTTIIEVDVPVKQALPADDGTVP